MLFLRTPTASYTLRAGQAKIQEVRVNEFAGWQIHSSKTSTGVTKKGQHERWPLTDGAVIHFAIFSDTT
jgi:hypothetical protein